MCDFIPLIFVCGCDKQLSQEGNEAHICPRCVLPVLAPPFGVLSRAWRWRARGDHRALALTLRSPRSCNNGTVYATKERNCFTLCARCLLLLHLR